MEIAYLIAVSFLLAVAIEVTYAQDKKDDERAVTKPPPGVNPLESLILNQNKNNFEPRGSLSRVKRQYRRYPYPYPIPILIGGGFGRGIGGGYGGRGFGGRGFGGRGFGGRGFGGGIGGRGIGGGFGGGRGGGRG